MMNLFPELLFLGALFSPFLVRLAAGAAFLALSLRHLRRDRREIASSLERRLGAYAETGVWALASAELAAGVSLLLGALTQAGAIVGFAVAALTLFLGRSHKPLRTYSQMTYALLLFMCLSLLFSGAGAFAVDVPF